MGNQPVSRKSRKLIRWGGSACLAGGVLWVLLWIAYLLTHGPTMSDFEQTLLSLTWYDYGKFVPLALLLFLFGLVSLRARQAGQSGWFGTVGFFVAVGGFVILIVSMLAFWLVPFGSYNPTYRNTELVRQLTIVQFTSPLILGTGLILYGIEVLRSKMLRQANALPLVVGLTALVPYLLWTNVGFVFGAAWAALGLVMSDN